VFLSTINTQPSTGLANFSDKEKDEAGLSDGFRQDSLDAFILRFAGMKAFLFFAPVRPRSRPPGDFRGRERGRERGRFIPRWSLNQNPFREFVRGTQLKDQPMKKVRFVSLALAGLSVLSVARAITITENFSANPWQNGWRIFGDTNLFQWNSTNHNLAVTWDSSQTNSYFYHPLGTILTRQDDFSIALDLQLNDVAIGGYGFELAIGLFNLADATRSNFFRGTGYDSPNLVELDYFPDPDGELLWGPSITAIMVDSIGTGNTDWSQGGYAGLTLPLNDLFHIEMVYTGSNSTLHTTITCNGRPFGPIPDAYPVSGFQDFRVDNIAVSSYSDTNGWGSILAHGVVDNFVVTIPPLPVQNLAGSFSNAVWQAQFISRSNWLYTLERTTNFLSWTAVSGPASGNGTNLFLPDANPPTDKTFYRVRAERP
jgi:hypothetical protein